jgi:hypothetical protein
VPSYSFICFSFLLFVFLIALGGGTLWHLQKFLQCITHEFTPSTILLYPSFLPFQNSFNRSHFSICITVYTVFAPYSPSCTLPPPHPSPALVPTARQDLYGTPVLPFGKKKKKMTFFVYDNYTGSFLVTFPCIITEFIPGTSHST